MKHLRTHRSTVRYDPLMGVSMERLVPRTAIEIDLTNSVTLSFDKINYQLNVANDLRLKLPCCKSKETKSILFNVSGIFPAGMNAILGPTGCGKSTLLDILADRKARNAYQGEVLINNFHRPSSSAYRYMMGYVVQDDIFSGTLTVRENIMFSANLRLPQSVPFRERVKRVSNIIEQLGLIQCADTRMGTEFQRGVSGGERKRTCIAMEMVLSPSILFLDEPTTGLDASTASNVMNCLRDLSKNGCTIVFSIHQPRHSIFQLFDKILLMLNGRVVYHGSSGDMMSYFAGLGFHCNTNFQENPADFALDTLNQVVNTPAADVLYESYGELDHFSNRLLQNETVIVRRPQRSLWRDFFYVSQRTLRNALRNSALLMWQILVAILLGLLTGLLYYQIPRTIGSGVQNRLGGIFFIVVNQIFSTATALEPFIKERALFIHENTSGYYHISTLFLAKLACDLVPLRVIPSVVFSVICYFMTGLQRTVSKFIIFLLTIFMANVFGSAMCFCIAACIPVFAVALIVLVLIFVIMMVFSGFLVDLSSVFSFLRWIQWISAFRYASNVLYINEFRDLQFCSSNHTNICPVSGNSILQERSIDHASHWDLWKYFLALTFMAIISFLFAYLRLRLIKKMK